MPLYEFRCESCGHETETIVAFSDPLPSTCEECGGALKKLLAAPAVQFKGSGFYLTDYGKSGSSGAPAAKEKESGGGAPAKPSGDAKASGDTAGGSSAASAGGDAKPKG